MLKFLKKFGFGFVSVITPFTCASIDTTWTATLSNDMTGTINWDNGVPTSLNNAIFDTSITTQYNPQLPGTSGTSLFAESFSITSSGTLFNITINGTSSLVFSGTGIIGPNTGLLTLTATNDGDFNQTSNASTGQIQFVNDGSIINSIGNTTINILNTGTISIVQANDFGQLLFEGSGGYFGGVGNSVVNITGTSPNVTVTNEGSILITSSNSNDVAQILFDGSGGCSTTGTGQGHSSVSITGVIGGIAMFSVNNSGTIMGSTSDAANDIAQILFDGSGGVNLSTHHGIGTSTVNIGNNVILAADNNNGSIIATHFNNDLAQILFDGSGGASNSSSGQGKSVVTIGGALGGTATLIANNSGALGSIINSVVNDVAQILFDGSGGVSTTAGGTGTSSVVIGSYTSITANNNRGVLQTIDSTNDLAQILFDGSGGVGYNGTPLGYSQVFISGTLEGEVLIGATNSGTLSNSQQANDIAQILFDGSGGLSKDTHGGTGRSNVTIGGYSQLVADNNGGFIASTFPMNDIAQILFDGSGGASSGAGGHGHSMVSIAGALSSTATLFAVNSGTLGGMDLSSINDIAQILFDGSGGLNNSTFSTGTSSVIIGKSSSIIAFNDNGMIQGPSNMNDLAQILFDGSGGFGTVASGLGYSNVSISGGLGETATLSATNSGTLINNRSSNASNDIAQILFDGSGGAGSCTGTSSVMIGEFSSITALNDHGSLYAISKTNDLAQILFDGSGGFGKQSQHGKGNSSVIIGMGTGSATLIAINSNTSTIYGSDYINDIAQILFDGSGGFSSNVGGIGLSSVDIGGNSVLIADNQGVIEAAEYMNDIAQILFDGSGGFGYGDIGYGYSSVNIGGLTDEAAVLLSTNTGTMTTYEWTNDVAQILFDGSGGLTYGNPGSGTSSVVITGNTLITASNDQGFIGNSGDQLNDMAQILFDGSGGASNGRGNSSVQISGVLGSAAILSANNSGIISNTGTMNDMAQILFDGSSGLGHGGSGNGLSLVTIGNDVLISANNSGSIVFAGSGTTNGVAQILFDGRFSNGGSGACNVTSTGTNGLITATNTGIINGDQIAFYDTNVNGPLFIEATSSGSGTCSQGIAFYGTLTNASEAIASVYNTSLWFDSGLNPNFEIGMINGDSTSTAILNQMVVISGNGSGTFNGVISGGSSLFMKGSGALALFGNNTYSGGIEIINGSIYLGSNNGLGAGTLTMNGGALNLASGIIAGNKMNVVSSSTIGVPNGVAAYSGLINGSASLAKVGQGVLGLTGSTSPYSGTITIIENALSINGSLPNATVLVNQGTTLYGTGFIGTAIVNGFISPGNSIGTLKGTTFQLNSGSTYIDEIGKSRVTDLISALEGTITINPGANLQIVPQTFESFTGNIYLIAEAGAILGSHFNVLFPYIRYAPQVSYLSNAITLEFTTNPYLSILPRCANPNERNIAGYIDFLDRSGTVPTNSELSSLITMLSYVTSSQQLADNLNNLHPAPYNTMVVAQEQTMLVLRDGIAERLDEIRTGGRLVDECVLCKAYEWVAPIASFSRQLSNTGKAGYKGSMGGIMGGIDFSFDECYTGGIGIGYTNTSVDWTSTHGSGSVESGFVGLYGQANLCDFFIDGSVMIGGNRFRGHRSIYVTSAYDTINEKVKARFNGTQVESYLAIGTSWSDFWDYEIDTDLIASVDWIYNHQGRINESGAGGLDLVVQEKNCNLIRSSVGVFLSKEICHWVPEVGIAVLYYDRLKGGGRSRYRFIDQAGSLVAHGLYPSEWRAAPQASLTGLFMDGDVNVQASYSGEYSRDYLENNFMINFGFRF